MNNVLQRFVATGLSATLGLMLVLANIAPAQATVNLEQGLVAHYPFNENANDESGNGKNGTVNGATLTEDRFGKKNSAYDFDGNNDYIITSKLRTSPTAETLSLWLYAEDSGVIVSELGQQTINSSYHYTKIGLNKNNELRGNIWACNGDLSFGALDLNKWYHATLVYDGTQELAYLDGDLKDRVTCARSAPSNQYLAFGAKDTQMAGGFNDSGYFDGKIDDVKLYSKALTAAEVQALYKDTDNNTQAEVDILEGNLTITAPKTVDFREATVSKTEQTLEVTLTDPNPKDPKNHQNYFTVEDLKGAAAGYYTTISVTDLTDGNKKVIAAENLSVQVPKGKVHKLAGYADANVVVPKGTQEYVNFTSSSPATLIQRSVDSDGLVGRYGVLPKFRLTVPAFQALGSYTGTMTYTLIEN